jgi:hypothetical protein
MLLELTPRTEPPALETSDGTRAIEASDASG